MHLDDKRTATLLLASVVAADAAKPVLVDRFVSVDDNPFVVSGVSNMLSAAIIGSWLWANRRLAAQALPGGAAALRSWRVWTMCVARSADGSGLTVRPAERIAEFWRCPVFWGIVGALNEAFFYLSIQLAETAVVVVVLWGAWSVVFSGAMAGVDAIETSVRRAGTSTAFPNPWLLAAAGIGCVVAAGSGTGVRIADLTSDTALAGLAVAVFLTVPLGSLRSAACPLFGRLASTGLGGAAPPAASALWLGAMLGFVGRLTITPIQAAVSVWVAGSVNVSGTALTATMLLGITHALVSLGIWAANISAGGAGNNAMFALVPCLSLAALAVFGIEVQHFKLFLAGTAAVTAANLAIQWQHHRPACRRVLCDRR